MNDVLYTKPWMRAAPYLVGMLGAIAWTRYRPVLVSFADKAVRVSALSVGIRAPLLRWQAWLRTHSLVYHLVYLTLLVSASALFFDTTKLYQTADMTPTWSKARAVLDSVWSHTAWAACVIGLLILWVASPFDALTRILSAGFWCVMP
jgi:hypothetical protein